jgi:hypothetical protein
MKDRLLEERTHDICSRMIAKRLLIYMEKKKLQKKRLAIILIQSIMRKCIERKKFKVWRKSLIRIICVEVRALPQRVIEGGQVIVTVFDTFKNVQLFRIDKTAECALQESFFIPGRSYLTDLLCVY